MINQLVLVGRLVNKPTIEELESGKKVSRITLAVPRNYKNSEGEYDTDFIPVALWNSIAETTAEYCRNGDLIGIKGRMSKLNREELSVIAEKITFLSSARKDEE